MGVATRIGCLVGVAFAVAIAAPACSQGEGDGGVVGTLNVPNCWTGPFDLNPTFFSSVPFRETTLIRLQSGSDFKNFSDGLSILLNDIHAVRPSAAAGITGKYRVPLRVGISPEVTPPGTPVAADPNPPLVGMTLYLQRTCQTQNVTLHAVDEVSVPNDGTCAAPARMGVDPSQGCAPDKEAPSGVGSGKSLIAFTSVANGKLDEETAAERLNAGCFDIYLADPREAQPGGQGPPPRCRGHLRGSFSFFFERGRPSQPFP